MSRGQPRNHTQAGCAPAVDRVDSQYLFTMNKHLPQCLFTGLYVTHSDPPSQTLSAHMALTDNHNVTNPTADKNKAFMVSLKRYTLCLKK